MSHCWYVPHSIINFTLLEDTIQLGKSFTFLSVVGAGYTTLLASTPALVDGVE